MSVFSGTNVRINYSYIPFTNIKIYLNGDIDSDDIVKYKNDNDEWCVISSFWVEPKEYLLSFIIAISFRNFHIPFENWNDVYYEHIDHNKNNISPFNLVCYFKIKIPCKLLHGFYYIPGFSRYVINELGEVYNSLTNKRMYVSTTYDGYNRYRLIPDTRNSRVSVGVHRLIAVAFLTYPVNIDELTVNHKDGDKLNNLASNLEWMSRLQNTIHAKENGLLTCNKPFLVRDIITNEITEYYSTIDYSKKNNIKSSIISRRLRTPNQPIFSNNCQYKYLTDLSEWRNPSSIYEEKRRRGFSRPICIENILNGERKEYETTVEASKDIGVNQSRLHKYINKNIELNNYLIYDLIKE